MNENEFFYNLTPEVILKAVEDEGFVTTGVFWKLNSFENRVYDLELEEYDLNTGKRSHIIVKFYRPGRWTQHQILEEHEFLFDLVDSEIPVCAPEKFKDGSSLKLTGNIFFAVWKRTGGRCVDEFSSDQLANLGRLLGRIHLVGRKKDAVSRFKLASENLCTKPLDYMLEHSFIPNRYEKEYINAVKRISVIYDQLSEGVPFHRIHGDCHIGNLLFGDNGFFFLDFDDFYTGPAVQDFWMLLPGHLQDSLAGQRIHKSEELGILLDNYRMFADFDDKWLDLIEPLRAMRYVNYAGWIVRRWEDPSFKNAFPHFGTEAYWEQETRDLQEQLKIIEKEKHVVLLNDSETETKEEPELSNADFFWDWEEKK